MNKIFKIVNGKAVSELAKSTSGKVVNYSKIKLNNKVKKASLFALSTIFLSLFSVGSNAETLTFHTENKGDISIDSNNPVFIGNSGMAKFDGAVVNEDLDLSKIKKANLSLIGYGAFYGMTVDGDLNLQNLDELVSGTTVYCEHGYHCENNTFLQNAFQLSHINGNVDLSGLTSASNMENAFNNSVVDGSVDLSGLTSASNMENAFQNSVVDGDVNLGSLTSSDNMENSFSHTTINNVNLGSLTSSDNMENAFSYSTVQGDVNLGSLTSSDNMSGVFENAKIQNGLDLGALTSSGSLQSGFNSATIGGDVNLGSLASSVNMENAFQNSVVDGDVNLSSLTSSDNMENSFSYATINNVNLDKLNSSNNMSGVFDHAKIQSGINLGALTSSGSLQNGFESATIGGDVNLGSLASSVNMENAFHDSVVDGGVNLSSLTSSGSLQSGFESATIGGDVNLGSLTSAGRINNLLQKATIKGDVDLSNLSNATFTQLALNNLTAENVHFGTVKDENVMANVDKNNFGVMNNIKNFDFVYNDVDGKSVLDLMQFDDKNYFVVKYSDKDSYLGADNTNSKLIEGDYAKINPLIFSNGYTGQSYFKNHFKTDGEKNKLIEGERYFVVESPLYEDKRKINGQDMVDFASKLGIELNENHTGFKPLNIQDELDKVKQAITNITNTQQPTEPVDNGGNVSLQEAKNYSDAQDTIVLNTAKEYANAQDAVVLDKAKEYANKTNTTVSGSKSISVVKTTNEDGANDYNVALADDVEIESSLTIGDIVIDKNGINAGNEKVSNVAKGEVSKTSKDAVNGSQLYELQQKIDNLDLSGVTIDTSEIDRKIANNSNAIADNSRKIQQLDNKINDMDKRLTRGIAMSGAMGLLGQPTMAGESYIGAAVSNYNGEQALAVGYSRISDNKHHLIKFGGSTSFGSNSKFMVGASYGYKW